LTVEELVTVLLAMYYVSAQIRQGRRQAEALTPEGQSTGLLAPWLWTAISTVTDTPALFLLFSLHRLDDSPGFGVVIALLAWGAFGFLTMPQPPQQNPHWLLDALPMRIFRKILSDIGDGFILFSIIVRWQGWDNIQIPPLTINF
jgi:hypothetical protein